MDQQHLSLIGVGRGLILHHMAVVMSLCGRACVPRGSWPPGRWRQRLLSGCRNRCQLCLLPGLSCSDRGVVQTQT